jgi:hypothetical protein
MSSSLLLRLIKSSSDSMAVVVGVAGRAGPGSLGDFSGFVEALLAGGEGDRASGEALRFLFRGGVVVTGDA